MWMFVMNCLFLVFLIGFIGVIVFVLLIKWIEDILFFLIDEMIFLKLVFKLCIFWRFREWKM